MSGLKAFVYICLGVFAAAFIYAAISDPLLTTFFSILVHPEHWAFVVTTDLTIGLCFSILFIYPIDLKGTGTRMEQPAAGQHT